MENLKQTPFHTLHLKHQAMMSNFGGWSMPIRYSGDKKEHFAVRERVGLFDVSHMGEIEISGAKALDLLQYLTCNDVSKLNQGKIHYNALVNSQGGFIDDILIYQRGSSHYFLVVNAANREKDLAWILQQNENFGATIQDTSHSWAQLAIQGPHAVDVLEPLATLAVRELPYYHFLEGELKGIATIVSRTGYTASDGFEIYFSPEHAPLIWNTLLEVGKPFGLLPCGLGARDSLRIEGAMHLYGNEMNENISILEASLSWILKWNKGNFIGKENLLKQKEQGLTKKLVGFEMLEFGIPRKDYSIFYENQVVGKVTSGLLSPTLNKPIGLAYVPLELSAQGKTFHVSIRGKQNLAQVVKTPFYRIQR